MVSIGRILDIAPGVARPRRDDAGALADQILHAPETPPAKIAFSVGWLMTPTSYLSDPTKISLYFP